MTSEGYRRLGRSYTAVAQTLLGMVLVFGLLNAALSVFPSLRTESGVDTPMKAFGVDRLLPAYPGWSSSQLIQLHQESRVVFTFQPIVQFRIKPTAGSYVNASPIGFRSNVHQAPWPPSRESVNVFLFGGSTTFGWLLADRDAIGSQLQEQVAAAGSRRPVAIYNFGQPAYISTQEALFFQSLVMAGTVPDIAVFVDGFNDFFFRGEIPFTGRLRATMDGTDLRDRIGLVTDLPMTKLARRLSGWLFDRPPVQDLSGEQHVFQRIIAQWFRNKQLIEEIAQHHGVKTVFVWQPVATFQYDINQHFLHRQKPLAVGEPVPNADIGRAYALMSQRRQELEAQQNFLWLADMQADKRENLYVDRLHYNATFSGEIAGRILEFLNVKNLLGRAELN